MHDACEDLGQKYLKADIKQSLALVYGSCNCRATYIIPRAHVRGCAHADQLCVQSNEQGFTAADVHAICDVGAGTKTADAGRIGRKGIGFKSVFSICDSPYLLTPTLPLHSNPTQTG